MKPDLTVIICSTNYMQTYLACKSIQESGNICCQFLIHDNTIFNWSLAKVYNFYLQFAKADIILLCHQDIEFIGKHWFDEIKQKLLEKDCGLIGFAGSSLWIKMCSGWGIEKEYSYANFVTLSSKKIKYKVFTPQGSKKFVEVITLDGLAFFIKKEVLNKNKFDEQNLTGFHCYDIDISLSLVNNGFRNYVYLNKTKLSVFHHSAGNYGKSWIKETLKMYNNKWVKYNDLTTIDFVMSPEEKNKIRDKLKESFIMRINKFFQVDEAKELIQQIK